MRKMKPCILDTFKVWIKLMRSGSGSKVIGNYKKEISSRICFEGKEVEYTPKKMVFIKSFTFSL